MCFKVLINLLILSYDLVNTGVLTKYSTFILNSFILFF